MYAARYFPSCCSRFSLLGALLCVTAPVAAAEVSAYATATTDFVWRGVTQSDGDPALQLGADLSIATGIYLGFWGSTIDISNGPTRQRDTQVNYYIGYVAPSARDWSFGGHIVAYTFPGAESDIDYDYLEIALTANYDDRLWFEYSYSDDLYHSGRRSHNFDIYAEHALAAAWTFGVGAGYYDVSSLTGSGYANWQLGVTHSIKRVDIDLRYHDTNQWVPIVSSAERADARVALSVTVSF